MLCDGYWIRRFFTGLRPDPFGFGPHREFHRGLEQASSSESESNQTGYPIHGSQETVADRRLQSHSDHSLLRCIVAGFAVDEVEVRGVLLTEGAYQVGDSIQFGRRGLSRDDAWELSTHYNHDDAGVGCLTGRVRNGPVVFPSPDGE